MTGEFAALSAGFLLGAGLILAIGAQNAFLLKQGLRREYVGLLCFVCAFSDALLIVAGVLGFGTLVVTLPWVTQLASFGGAAFLIVYALVAFRSAWRGGATLTAANGKAASWQVAVGTCLALTWLNPHVYLDTVVLLGAASLRYEGMRLWFTIGAVSASFSFFYALGFGARLLQPVFAKPMAWRVLDVLIGCIMLGIAISLLR